MPQIRRRSQPSAQVVSGNPKRVTAYGRPPIVVDQPAKIPCPGCSHDLLRDNRSGKLVCFNCRGAFTVEQVKQSMDGRARLEAERRRAEVLERNRVYRQELRERAAQERKDAATVGVVYYIRFRDAVKIGTTINPDARLRDHPWDELLALEPGGRKTERLRHVELHKHRLTGEWFELNDAVSRHIEGVKRDNADWFANVFWTIEGLPSQRRDTVFPIPSRDYPDVC